jgi:hypothetical protein
MAPLSPSGRASLSWLHVVLTTAEARQYFRLFRSTRSDLPTRPQPPLAVGFSLSYSQCLGIAYKAADQFHPTFNDAGDTLSSRHSGGGQ